ncbi:MAG: hypothetical protein ACRD2N_18740 [Vicinamibacterales bacterium]
MIVSHSVTTTAPAGYALPRDRTGFSPTAAIATGDFQRRRPDRFGVRADRGATFVRLSLGNGTLNTGVTLTSATSSALAERRQFSGLTPQTPASRMVSPYSLTSSCDAGKR